ncbi:hypothetical protein OUZ56_033021 [Daphnia magna]|uniref:Uncharacterized protein n=1 Tax=Daphnia magna TaxID=35525 RepID=A0ABR0BA01_9CRUS|nr:hypothetical protein OUZ56_033021 [Daphnia magna]
MLTTINSNSIVAFELVPVNSSSRRNLLTHMTNHISKNGGEIGPDKIGPYNIGPSNRTYKIGPYKIGPL